MRKIYCFVIALFLTCLAGEYSFAQVTLQDIQQSYHQDFDSLAATGTSNDIATLPTGWTFAEGGTNGNTTYAAGTGSSNAGNTYSFGLTNERALGGLLSGSLTPSIGASFVNNTGATITSFEITYTGEQWRLGTAGRNDRLDFQYSLDASSLTTGTWTEADALDFVAAVSTGTTGALNGNDSLNQVHISATISGVQINDGQTFYVRWTDFNATGADDGLAVDNFTLTPEGVPPTSPAITLTPASLAFGDVNVFSVDTLSYTVKGANLGDSIKVSNTNNAFTVSRDGVYFSNAVTIDAGGATLFVRFAPVESGIQTDSVLHQSGGTTRVLKLSGNGFDQASSIIAIAAARQQPVGKKVTIAGRVTVADQLGNPAYVQDATGGIPVFDYALAQAVKIGDSVVVTGPVGVFNDQVQISGAGIIFTKADTIPDFVLPKIITLDQLAAYEGQLVSIQNVQLVNKNFIFYPQSTEFITSNGAQAELRVDGDTDLPGLQKPKQDFTVTGVVGRFKANAQLLPRFREDVPGATEGQSPSDSIARSKTLDIVNWNLEFFGAKSQDYGNEEYGPVDEALQLKNVKAVLQSLHADIIAVQEISDDSLWMALVNELGQYAGTCSDRYSYSFDGPSNTFPPQKVCFLYDTTTIKLVAARPLFANRYDSARTIDGSLLAGYPTGDASSFYSSGRLPYSLTVEANIDGVRQQLSFINIHAKSGATAADRNRRLYDTRVLKDSLDKQYAGEKFIILGDLNDDLDQSITPGLPSPYADYVSDTVRYFSITKVLSDAGARSTISFSDMIDHQIASRALAGDYISGSARVITPFGLIPNYANTTSDHLPVMTRYAFKPAVVNFAQGKVTRTEAAATGTVDITIDAAADNDRTILIKLTGTATDGADYKTLPAAVNGVIAITIPANTTSASLEWFTIDDTIDELEETAIFTMQPSAGIVTGDNATFELVLQDNDVPAIAFKKFLDSGREGEGDNQIKLQLSTPVATDQQVTLNVYQGPGVGYGTDYTLSAAPDRNEVNLNIPAGSATVDLSITPLIDNKREFPEIVTLYLSKTSEGLKPGVNRVFVFTILDNTKRRPQFAAYPNPTNGPVRIIAHDVDETDLVLAELRNPQGQMIYSGSATVLQLNEALQHKLQSERRGLYTLKLALDGEVYLVRILKI